MENQRIGGERPFLGRDRRRELFFHDDRIVGIRDANPVCDPQHVAIHRQARHAQRVAQDDVGGLASHARELDEIVHARRHFAPVSFHERAGHAGQRLRLGSEEAGRLNLRLQLRGRGLRQRAGVRVSREEGRRDSIDALVRALRRENRGDEQLVRIAEVELGERAGMLALELFEDLADPPARLHVSRGSAPNPGSVGRMTA